MQTQETDGWSLRCLNNPKGIDKRMVVDRQKVITRTVQEVQSGRQTRGQGRQNGQAGEYRVQNRQGSKMGED
jgi:hypothetical protein